MSCHTEYMPAYHQHPWQMCHHYHPCPPYPYYYYGWCTVCCRPYHLCCCRVRSWMNLPQEITVDPSSTPKEALVGGSRDAALTLEYVPDTGKSATAAVTLTITSPDGTTSTWNVTGMTEEFHVKDDFASLSPGSRIKLEVVDATARVRWCEAVCC